MLVETKLAFSVQSFEEVIFIFIFECGKLVRVKARYETFKDCINTSQNPSTRTLGHRNCGVIFSFVDGNPPKMHSSRKELKMLEITFEKEISCLPKKLQDSFSK